ncbi:hypothetical protein BT96DRAFT_1005975 [Gymnopus androsaceus JB14]|uniref:Uncharacterized protein n=1 Tax=Gymnopus androsaceus JB14 TaxID=1447944 RepID=A0A6A4GLJ8_9AGAR|nr:hypothetical protein BT96DRAFT_1005975 [Gymnopus androsaceus JB14]
MSDQLNNQRNLRHRGPNGRVLPPNSNSGSTDSRGQSAAGNFAALHRLLSPLADRDPADTSGSMDQTQQPQAQPRTILRPISMFRPDLRIGLRPSGGPSNSDAASAEPNHEGNQRDTHAPSRSPTRSSNGEEDPLHPAFFIDRPRFPFNPVPLHERADTVAARPLFGGSCTGMTGRTGASGSAPPSAAPTTGFPPYVRLANPDGGPAGPSQMGPPRAGLTVRFDQASSGGGSDSQNCSWEPQEPAHHAPSSAPNAITDGATGDTYVRDQQGNFVQHPSTRRQEKSRDSGNPTPSSSRRWQSLSPRRDETQDNQSGGSCHEECQTGHSGAPDPQLRLPALNPTTFAPGAGLTLPPIAPLMDYTYQYNAPPSHDPTLHNYYHGYHPAPTKPLPLPPLTHPGRAPLAPIQPQGWYAYPQSHHFHPSMQHQAVPKPTMDTDKSTLTTRPTKKKIALADPCKAVVGSLSNPFHSRTDGLSEALSSGDSLLLESGAGSVSLKARGFTEIPIEETDRSDFTGIATNFPRAVCEHLIPHGETEVGSDHALAITDMFQGLFQLVQDREDFHEITSGLTFSTPNSTSKSFTLTWLVRPIADAMASRVAAMATVTVGVKVETPSLPTAPIARTQDNLFGTPEAPEARVPITTARRNN